MTSPPATAPSPAVIDANAQLDALKKEFAAASPNLARCSQMLAALKVNSTVLNCTCRGFHTLSLSPTDTSLTPFIS